MVRKEKELAVQELTDKMKSTNGVVITEYQGLTVLELSELRAKLRPLRCEYKVVKNTLTKRALKDLGLEDFSQYFQGPTAIAIENGDPVACTKVLVDFSKDHDKLKLKMGLLGKKVLSQQEVKSLAKLPSREVLLAQVVGAMKSPMYGIVNVLQGPIRNFVYVLEAVKKQKPQQ